MAAVGNITIDSQMPPGGLDQGPSAMVAVGGTKKNLMYIKKLPFDGLNQAQLIPVYYTRTTPVYTDYSADPIGTEIEKYTVDDALGITAFAKYAKVANAGAATDIKQYTIA